MKSFIFIFLAFCLTTQMVSAEEYQIFDGQMYNNLYYPRIDIIEWGDPLHLEFHVYQKDKPVDVSGIVIERGGKKVFTFAYDLSYRGERRCRAVPAPPHWQEGQKLNFYSDKSDKDMNRIIVSAEKMKDSSSYVNKDYSTCVEVAAHSARKKEIHAAQKTNNVKAKRKTASEEKPPKPKSNLPQASPQEDGDKNKKQKDQFESDLGAKNLDWFSE